MHEHPDNVVIGPNGRTTTPMKIVTDDETMHGTHNGGVCVHSGTFTLGRNAVLNGSLHVDPDAQIDIYGTHNGSVYVAHGARVAVHGRANGSVHVDAGGHVRVEPRAGIAGSLHIEGTVENAGTRAGSVSNGGGELLDLPGSHVIQPTIRTDGTHLYNF